MDDETDPRRELALHSLRQAFGALQKAAEAENDAQDHELASRKAKIAAALVMLEDAFHALNDAGAGTPSEPEFGYGHPAHRPDPQATYFFNPGPWRLLPTRADRRWRTPG